ncbi:PspA/IM30 family protein [Hahella ganghwensis]|uniref:PspA/IM30 family protein n=1 Tax=Hahella ganghwensis TaxID=286420 RepID=UPI00037EC85A|nr:PspA/IM30 family protein [Hahella ganghwensis]
MALFNRFIRLFKADMHAVMDHLEEPDVLLRQAIREMEEEVDQGARQLKARQIEQQQIQSRISTLQESVDNIQDQLNLCFEADNDLLAKTLLRRRLESDRLIKQLKQQDHRLSEEIRTLTKTQEDQHHRLEAMQQKAAVFDTADDSPHKESAWNEALNGMDRITDEDVEVAFLQEQQKRGRNKRKGEDHEHA